MLKLHMFLMKEIISSLQWYLFAIIFIIIHNNGRF